MPHKKKSVSTTRKASTIPKILTLCDACCNIIRISSTKESWRWLLRSLGLNRPYDSALGLIRPYDSALGLNRPYDSAAANEIYLLDDVKTIDFGFDVIDFMIGAKNHELSSRFVMRTIKIFYKIFLHESPCRSGLQRRKSFFFAPKNEIFYRRRRRHAATPLWSWNRPSKPCVPEWGLGKPCFRVPWAVKSCRQTANNCSCKLFSTFTLIGTRFSCFANENNFIFDAAVRSYTGTRVKIFYKIFCGPASRWRA